MTIVRGWGTCTISDLYTDARCIPTERCRCVSNTRFWIPQIIQRLTGSQPRFSTIADSYMRGMPTWKIKLVLYCITPHRCSNAAVVSVFGGLESGKIGYPRISQWTTCLSVLAVILRLSHGHSSTAFGERWQKPLMGQRPDTTFNPGACDLLLLNYLLVLNFQRCLF